MTGAYPQWKEFGFGWPSDRDELPADSQNFHFRLASAFVGCSCGRSRYLLRPFGHRREGVDMSSAIDVPDRPYSRLGRNSHLPFRQAWRTPPDLFARLHGIFNFTV